MDEARVSYVERPFPWISDQGDGTYVNPVIHADYSDPDVIRIGDEYWMVSSSFSCCPGLPLLCSRDLVNWRLAGYALKEFPVPGYDIPRLGGGVWAPAIRKHNGKCFIYFPLVDEGIYVVTAHHPSGPWSQPQQVLAGKGLIDPCPFWDEDGRSYLVHAYARSRSGIAHQLCLRQMTEDGLGVLDEGWTLYDGSGVDPFVEGPKLYRIGSWYYVFAPAGGVATGWQLVLRSGNLRGSWERRVVLAQKDTAINGPHQGALVDTPSGEWWFLHFSDGGPYGRMIYLEPVAWIDEWPVIGRDALGTGVGSPVYRYRKPDLPLHEPVSLVADDDWSGSSPGLQWQWSAGWTSRWWSLSERPGWLRLRCASDFGGDLERAPNLLLQKWPAGSFSATVWLDDLHLGCGPRAGVIVTGKRSASLTVERCGEKRCIVWRIGSEIQAVRSIAHGIVCLRVDVAEGAIVSFGYLQDEKSWCMLRDAPPHRAEADHWMGSKVGLCAIVPDGVQAAGCADFGPWRMSSLLVDESVGCTMPGGLSSPRGNKPKGD